MSEHPNGAPGAEQPKPSVDAAPSASARGETSAGCGPEAKAGAASGPGAGSGFGSSAGGSPPPWPNDPRHAGFHPYPGMGYPPPAPDWGAPPHWGAGYGSMAQGYGPEAGARHAHGPGMAGLVNEIASGGSGLSSLSRMLDLDDPDLWKGALVGAAAVLLLNNDSVRGALFGGRRTTGAQGKTEPAS